MPIWGKGIEFNEKMENENDAESNKNNLWGSRSEQKSSIFLCINLSCFLINYYLIKEYKAWTEHLFLILQQVHSDAINSDSSKCWPTMSIHIFWKLFLDKEEGNSITTGSSTLLYRFLPCYFEFFSLVKKQVQRLILYKNCEAAFRYIKSF